MIDSKVRNQRVDAGLTERAGVSTGGDIARAMAGDVGRSIRGACHSFARAVDWQHHSRIVSHAADGELGELEWDTS
jgi:hypothetical protein